MNQSFKDFMEKHSGRRIAIAVSGGMDSMYLMHRCAEFKMDAVVLTVDHGLRPESAAEAELVATAAVALGFSHVTLKWTGDKPTSGIEEAARNARYELMLSWCADNNVGMLALAHQADDQIETFLMNLGRGSGAYGLAAMRTEQVWAPTPPPLGAPLQRRGITIARPMLSIMRAEIKEYITSQKIKYIDDSMNRDENFLRVRIRKNRHLLHDRLGIPDSRVLLAIESLGRVRDMLQMDVERLVNLVCPPTGGTHPMQSLIAWGPRDAADSPPRGESLPGRINLDWSKSVTTPPLGESRRVSAAKQTGDAVGGQCRATFSTKFLFDMPPELRMKFLSVLLQRIGNLTYPPRLEKIQRALTLLKSDCKFTVSHCIIRRLRDKILIAPEGTSVSFRNK